MDRWLEIWSENQRGENRREAVGGEIGSTGGTQVPAPQHYLGPTKPSMAMDPQCDMGLGRSEWLKLPAFQAFGSLDQW